MPETNNSIVNELYSKIRIFKKEKKKYVQLTGISEAMIKKYLRKTEESTI